MATKIRAYSARSTHNHGRFAVRREVTDAVQQLQPCRASVPAHCVRISVARISPSSSPFSPSPVARLLGRLRRTLTGLCPRLRLEVIVHPKAKDLSTIVPAVPRSTNNIGRGNRRQVQVEIFHFDAPVWRKHRLDARTNGQSSRCTGRTRPGSAVLTAHVGSKSKLSGIFEVSEGRATSL
jgi:hypothetical protein